MSILLELLDHMPPYMYRELLDLQGIPQDKRYHPEGDAFDHTILVVEAAEQIALREQLGAFDTMVLLNAAITHDLGKVSTTEVHSDGRITSYGHDEAGVPLAYEMLTRLGVANDIIDPVVRLVRYHMAHLGFAMPSVTKRAVRRLAKKLYPATVEMWALLVEADYSGRPPLEGGLPARAKEVLDMAREMGINDGDLSSLR